MPWFFATLSHFDLVFYLERANNKAEGRIGGAAEGDARDRAQNRESFKGVETGDRRG